MNLIQEVLKAEQRIRRYIKETPLEYSLALGQMTGYQVFVKLENLQHTGSFKARGATARWMPMGKGVSNLWRYGQVALQSNVRYLNALAVAQPKGKVSAELDHL